MITWLWLAACSSTAPSGAASSIDRDRDGYIVGVDCNDGDAAIHPNANDPAYDGVDADCAGDDDYDADGDGSAWDRYGGGDCNDQNPDIGPHVEEIIYDFIDNDCDPSTTDGDLDGDGSSFPSDCDDNDPDRYPGALERLGDAIDGDCGNDGDGTVLAVLDVPLDRPRSLRLATFEGDPVLVMVLERLIEPATPAPIEILEPAVAWLHFGEPDQEQLIWHGRDNTGPFATDPIFAVDAEGSGDTLWLGIGYRSIINERRWMLLEPHIRHSLDVIRLNGPTIDLKAGADLDGVDVHIDDAGEGWMVAAGPDVLAWARDAESGSTPVDASAGALLGGDPTALWSCPFTGSCSSWSVGPDSGAPEQGATLDDVERLLRSHQGLRLVATPDGAQVHDDGVITEVFTGDSLLDGDVVKVGESLVVAGLRDGPSGAEVLLSWGPHDQGLLNTARLPIIDERTPQEVAVWADANRVLVAVAGFSRLGLDGDDRILVAQFGWASPP